MKTLRIFLFILIIVGIGLLATEHVWVPKLVDHIIASENKNNGKVADQENPENTAHIISPSSGENLVAGKTYTIKWAGGPDPTQIFLIDTSLKSAGVSVSISDRVYNVKNTGSYDYTVPASMKAGVYQFEIGSLESDTFTISN